ncbi:MAG TPA: hypothetical protein VKP11_09440 [Frankiaceae bacterium]|nr:hypothetical protein [Frankiaceae bacterium]
MVRPVFPFTGRGTIAHPAEAGFFPRVSPRGGGGGGVTLSG